MCESAKLTTYKMRKFHAKYFAFYTPPFWAPVSHFRIMKYDAVYVLSAPVNNERLNVGLPHMLYFIYLCFFIVFCIHVVKKQPTTLTTQTTL